MTNELVYLIFLHWDYSVVAEFASVDACKRAGEMILEAISSPRHDGYICVPRI